MPGKVSLYASVGPELTHYDVDVEGAALTRRGTVGLPANVQYVWPHTSRRFLYVATSDSASGMGQQGNTHHVTAFGIGADGALNPHGPPIRLPTRPIHMATDVPSQYILVAFSNPSAIRVYRINADATPGEEVAQPGPIDPGIFAHQVRATPDNRLVILVTRGHDAATGKAEEPGALKVFDFKDGVLSNEVSVAPDGGYGFGPRHLDFHPSKPWVYVSLERQNALDMFELANGAISPVPRFRKNALGSASITRQAVGTVHVHPNGRAVYVANRAATADGENSLAVYTIDQSTGEPHLIEHADTRGVHPRTFHIDPSGRLMAVAHITGAVLSLFRIGEDGGLHFVRAYDIDVGNRTMWWMGMVEQ
ncbi:MAG TPA: beta-propeller fold lactonase family protein [Acetobacteraceae bacterium]|nr:beta-propeller fold lactonase family protein [Acetobacteraceae bacterium]